MARSIHKLSDAVARSDRLKAGRHSDGGGLYLSVSPSGAKSWVFMWTREGKRREMGLGGYPEVSLAKARARAASFRETLADGRDPLAERSRAAEPTFGACADKFLRSMESSWRNEKHRAQWQMTLTHYCQKIRDRKISTIDTEAVLSVLQPIWLSKPETASRLRGRIERVVDFATAHGWRRGENPARWRGHLKGVLPPRTVLSRGHHAAMPYQDLPVFFERLGSSDAIASKALAFLILTAARSGEVLGATWPEIDLQARLWTVPAVRMKAAREHRVPLSSAAIEVLQPLFDGRTSEYVFPGQREGRPLSSSAMEMLLRRMKAGQYTAHGFRSAFRDWAGDLTQFPREIAEAALAHRVGDATELAYRRADAIEKRRELMVAWASYCTNNTSNIVPIGRARDAQL